MRRADRVTTSRLPARGRGVNVAIKANLWRRAVKIGEIVDFTAQVGTC